MLLNRFIKKTGVNIFQTCRLTRTLNNYFASIRKYTEEHEWLDVDKDSNVGKLGITDFAQSQLGDIVHVELPQVGQKFSQGDSIGTVESVKMAADVYTPVGGEIVGANNEVSSDVTLLNKDAEKNWLVQIKLANLSELDKLMTQEIYLEFVKKNQKK